MVVRDIYTGLAASNPEQRPAGRPGEEPWLCPEGVGGRKMQDYMLM